MQTQTNTSIDFPLPGDVTPQQALQQVPVQEVALAVVIPNTPKYMARDHIPAELRQQCEEYAHKLVSMPNFSVEWLAGYTRSFPLNTSDLESMIENIRAINSGDVGKRTWDATNHMRAVNKHLPAPNPNFIRRFNEGLAQGKEIVREVVWIYNQVLNALNEYNTLLNLILEDKTILQKYFDAMLEGTVQNRQLAENEDERTQKIQRLVAVFEFLQEDIKARLDELLAQLKTDPDNQTLKNEKDRLTGIAPLVSSGLLTLKPMIQQGNIAALRFVGQSNMAAGAAQKLGLFLTFGIARWEADVIQQLTAINYEAATLALSEAEKFMNEQAEATSDAYVAQTESYREMLGRWMISAETMQKCAQDIETAQGILADSFSKVATESANAARLVQSTKQGVDNSTAKFDAEISKMLGAN